MADKAGETNSQKVKVTNSLHFKLLTAACMRARIIFLSMLVNARKRVHARVFQ